MENELKAEKPDQTVYEGEGGAYYAWSPSKSPLLSKSKLGAGKLLLHPFGFALPHYLDSSKIAYVLQGACTVGLVPPNSPEEQVLLIKKGDALPLLMGVVSWWFNGGDTDVIILFLGETTKAQVPGQFTYFFLAGTLGILSGFQSDIVGKTFNLDKEEAENLVHSQPGAMIIKLGDGTVFPNPSKHIMEKIYAKIDTPLADVVVKGGGIINSLTERNFPMLGGIGLSAIFMRLESNAMLAPSYVADGSVQVIYVAKGNGRIQVVGSEGKPALDTEVKDGELLIVPQFFAIVEIADEYGMELFSIVTSSKPIFGPLAGNVSVWKALSPVVLQSALNISQEFEELFKSENANSITIVPPST